MEQWARTVRALQALSALHPARLGAALRRACQELASGLLLLVAVLVLLALFLGGLLAFQSLRLGLRLLVAGVLVLRLLASFLGLLVRFVGLDSGMGEFDREWEWCQEVPGWIDRESRRRRRRGK